MAGTLDNLMSLTNPVYQRSYIFKLVKQLAIELTEREAVVGSSSLIYLADSDIDDNGVGIF